MCQALRELMREEIADEMQMTREEGREEGRMIGLIEKVCRKLRKGQDAADIAEALEEDIFVIRKIIVAVEKCTNDYDVVKIYQAIEGGLNTVRPVQ